MRRLSWLAIFALAWESSTALAASPGFEIRECPESAAAAGARCGVVQVPENHAKPRGRKIALHVLVLPATGKSDGLRAQYDLEGGPGFAATDFLEFYAGEGAPYRVERDIVLADMRGTGQSNPLRCSAIEELEKRAPASPMYPSNLVAACAKQLGEVNDLSQYSTAAAAKDIDLVRRALGYEQLDINAISYGTTLALRYMADFPKAVHAAVLMGTVPANRTPPRFHATAAQASLDQLIADCSVRPACREQFGDVRANLAKSIDLAGRSEKITAPVFMEKLRSHLYSPAGRAGVPYLLAQAAKGDFSAFTGAPRQGRVFADGLYLSITCAESFAHMNVVAAIADSRTTTFGAYRLERQRDACRHWPEVAVDPGLMREKDSAVPVLFIAGELDPVSPADWAQDVAARFSHAKVVRVPFGGHILDGLSDLDTCLDSVVIRYMHTDSPLDIDLSCFGQMKAPEFGALR